MRLLNTTTLELHEFLGARVPPYAILSHTWSDAGEVSFADVRDPARREALRAAPAAAAKVTACCARAAQDGLAWAWVDTCCVDRTSTAELSEALNSVWAWYARADVCYVYLADVPPLLGGTGLREDRFRRARWFGRGWTLPELLAPLEVEFYAEDWTELGTKRSLRAALGRATGVPVPVLLQARPPGSCSVAERMSWASRRHTTRPEDAAYCLMGLFGVHMAPLYGEGAERAFLRLQEEVMRREEDYTIFLWRGGSGDPGARGFFAETPRAFAPAGPLSLGSKRSCQYANIKASTLFSRGRCGAPEERSRPCEITPRGLRMTLWTKPWRNRKRLAWTFSCYYDQMVCIVLEPVHRGGGGGGCGGGGGGADHAGCNGFLDGDGHSSGRSSRVASPSGSGSGSGRGPPDNGCPYAYVRSMAECVVLQATLDGFALEDIHVPQTLGEPRPPVPAPLRVDPAITLRLDPSPAGDLAIKETYPASKPQLCTGGTYLVRPVKGGDAGGAMVVTLMSLTHAGQETLFIVAFLFSPRVRSCQILRHDPKTTLGARIASGDIAFGPVADASDRILLRLPDGSCLSAAIKSRLGRPSASVSLIPGLPN